MRLILLCAAATPGLRRGIFPDNESLDERGLGEACARVPLLDGIQTFWTSPTPSAVQTAAALGRAAMPIAALRECDYGSWAGKRLRDIDTADPEAYAAWLKNPDAAPHGGESIADVMKRVTIWLDGLSAQEDAVAVTHASVIRAAITHATDAGKESDARIDIAPMTATHLERDGALWKIPHRTEATRASVRRG
ncbi:MAG TPA: histidine phosphatase family protein [Magnetospirillaceae bacterium]